MDHDLKRVLDEHKALVGQFKKIVDDLYKEEEKPSKEQRDEINHLNQRIMILEMEISELLSAVNKKEKKEIY